MSNTTIYSRNDASIVVLNGNEYEPDESGAFTLPDAFATQLLGQYVAGERAWESQTERDERLRAAELARRADPATLLAEVEKLGGFAPVGADVQLGEIEVVDAVDALDDVDALRDLAKRANAKAKSISDAAKKAAAERAAAEKKAAADKAASSK